MSNEPISATINDHQSLPLTITPKDRDGDVVAVDSTTWASSDESICTVDPHPDGLRCLVISTGAIGTCTVTCSADVDLGDGVELIQQDCFITVVQSNAESLNMSAGVPVERDAPTLAPTSSPAEQPPPAEEGEAEGDLLPS